MSAEEQDRAEILENYRAQLSAMVDGDTEILAELLTEDFSLTHMTGYFQPKQEWLARMRAGQFTYHDAQERTVSSRLTAALPTWWAGSSPTQPSTARGPSGRCSSPWTTS